VKWYDSLKALPPHLRKLVQDNAGVMADRGEFFNATDNIVKPGPARRFIRAGESGGRSFLWYDQGGIAFYKQILVFDDTHVVAQSRGSWRDNLCSETDRLLAR
jgi:hypothetical protein